MKLREVVAINIRDLRKARGWSQEELAGLAGINRNYVGMLEAGKNAASVDKLEQIAAALEVDPASLLQRKP